MSDSINIAVPDIGDFDTVEVIELLVKVGDAVRMDQGLITVESDKASMEIPSSHAGVITNLSVKVGDKVKQGSVIAQLAAVANTAQAPAPAPASAPVPVAVATAPAVAPASSSAATATATPSTASTFSGTVDHDCDLVVLGAGPGGYSAAFRAADLGLRVILVERYSTLGGVCLNVGCIPSKALLHTAAVLEEAQSLAAHGISFGAPTIDLDKLRAFKDGVIGKLTGGLAGMARARKVTVLQGSGTFLSPHHLTIASDAGACVVKFSQAIIAAGSQSVKLPFLPEDDRIVDSTGALLLRSIPKRMLIIGGGIIGLEMGTVYSALGARLDVVEMQDGLMLGAARDFIEVDRQMRTNVPHIFAIGDIIGQPMLAHKAVHEGHVAAEVIAGQKSFFDARVIPSVAYTDPEVAWVGLTEEQAAQQGVAIMKGLFPWAASGRAIANGRDEGFTKLLFDATSHKILGGGIVGTHAGDLISEVALAIEMGADSVDIGKTIHPHPTLGETVGLAAEAALGHCTDLPPVRKR